MHPETKTLRTILKHCSLVKQSLMKITQNLNERAEVHDRSKMDDDEFEGFCWFNRMNPDLEYGSNEYKEAFESIKPHTEKAIKKHQSRNSHHPEYHGDDVKSMGWLDIIEMVCDWHAASQTYSNTGSFQKSVALCKKKYNFSTEQLWLIDEVAKFLE